MNTILASRNFNLIKPENKLLVSYLLGGYPDKESFLKLMRKCDAAGVDIFEIGFPSSNPYSDGEVIKKAHSMVDASICRDESYWKAVRKATSKPIWLMAYKSDLIETGFYKTLAEKGLIDALVIPDMNFEEHQRLGEELSKYKVDVVGFINPNMKDKEIEKCFMDTAIVYQQLYAGPTGMAIKTDDFEDTLRKGLSYRHVSIFAGFGISTAERVRHLLGSGFHGVIIGTAMIKKLNVSEEALIDFIKELKAAVKKAGESNEIHFNL